MDEETRTPPVPDEPTGVVHWDGPGHRKWPQALSKPAPSDDTEEDAAGEPVDDPLIQGFFDEEIAPSSPEDGPIPAASDGLALPEEDRKTELSSEPTEILPTVREEPTAPLPAPKEKEPAGHKKPGAPKNRSSRSAAGEKRGKKEKKRQRAPEPELDPRELERNYRPIRTRRDGRIGCLGGIMYAVFIICASVALAAFAWMSAADVLALNKPSGTVEITLPDTAFVEKEVEVKDEDGTVTGTKTVRAADIRAVSGVLKDYGLINYKWLFSLYSSFSHADEQLDPGTYMLSTNLDYRALVKRMQAGADSQLQTLVMFPEGFNMDQVFTRLEENGICSKADLYTAAAMTEFSYAFLEDAETGDAARLEGFLFPDTYYFYQGMQASSAINKFLSNLHYRITDEMWQQAKARGLTFRQAVTVASLIEREAANDEERGPIASVIYNRLAAGMPLQIDSTVVYALWDTGITKLTPELIQATDSPYNTYLYAGLPPGPICNPGMSSLHAALDPDETRYLFYALDTESGTHRFFTTLEEHEAFVATQDYG